MDIRKIKAREGIIRAFQALIVWLVISGIVSRAGAVLFEKGSARPDSTILTGMSWAFVLPLLVQMKNRWEVPDPYPNKRKRDRRLLMCAVSGFSGTVLSFGYGRIMEALRLTEHFSNEVQEGLFSASFPVQILVLGVFVPACEEYLFRRIVFGCLKEALPEWAAAVSCSLLFAIFHGNMIQMIYAFPMALFMQLLYHIGRGLEAPAAFHIAANLAAVCAEHFLH